MYERALRQRKVVRTTFGAQAFLPGEEDQPHRRISELRYVATILFAFKCPWALIMAEDISEYLEQDIVGLVLQYLQEKGFQDTAHL